ncbi:MAG: cysteine synthase family protein [Alphaproteobacteria bacterium]|jgi:cystathionine beta-synthase/cysteine synthase A|nr:cystathionine beta-synthase [Rhodospirillaceae bacterium]MDP6020765.1 cysteine synthase family protein [Alphaproteobacteria bacterium]MDP6257037.1 cysteine synthase family protein [Alphaproteobacteria bacterium]MDP7056420.1 cysteine synthase family protein [Alphaproteobacteria bacterium]MDP7230212.1 cysteine synthase family protein [Alphaproteobacteria bacterium]|tara:strand:- start:2375 stop:3328 length:954 start_codon:yes stop_codon:yes gene_type:complete
MRFETGAVNLLDTIGNTPLVSLENLFSKYRAKVFAKLEFFNPTSSIKDRIVHHIVADAEATGRLKPGGTIVENTSGNTGAAIAMIAALKGYRAVLTMPDKVSAEKQAALTALGAEIVVCPTDAAPGSADHYVQRARDIAAETPNSFMINQYDNLMNADAHYQSTGPEIWRQSGGAVDYFVASGSTGGTISGVGRYLKEQKSEVKVLMPDPIGSIYYTYFKTGRIDESEIGSYQVEGIGEDHIAKCMDFSVVDEMLQFTDDDAFAMTRRLAASEGILAGGSSGANLFGCMKLAERLDAPVNIVTVLPDSGLKYLSKIF